MNESLLREHLSTNLVEMSDDVLEEFSRALKADYSDALIAVVFYGSCMRSRQYENAVLDFYVIVDAYRHAYRSKWRALINKILPPNVFFKAIMVNGKPYQAKYAVVSQKDLSRKTSMGAFHPYFWARFSQPVATVFANNQKSLQWLISIQQQAVLTLVQQVDCMFNKQYTSQEFWVRALQLTYEAELRTESTDRAGTIYVDNASYYDEIMAAVNASGDDKKIIGQNKTFCVVRWKLRKVLGKFLSVMRLLKATMTFSNGIDYIAWKIHRHTGEAIEVNQRLRKYPWLFCWPLLWRLYRSGKIR